MLTIDTQNSIQMIKLTLLRVLTPFWRISMSFWCNLLPILMQCKNVFTPYAKLKLWNRKAYLGNSMLNLENVKKNYDYAKLYFKNTKIGETWRNLTHLMLSDAIWRVLILSYAIWGCLMQSDAIQRNSTQSNAFVAILGASALLMRSNLFDAFATLSNVIRRVFPQ